MAISHTYFAYQAALLALYPPRTDIYMTGKTEDPKASGSAAVAKAHRRAQVRKAQLLVIISLAHNASIVAIGYLHTKLIQRTSSTQEELRQAS